MNFEVASLESLCELIVDCPHSTPPKWTDEGIIVLRNQNIRNGILDLSSPSFTNEDDYSKRIKRAIPQAGDIVFTREAPMGEVCMIPDGLKCCLGQRQVLLRPKPSINSEYLFWTLQSRYVQQQIAWNEGTGSTVSNVRIPVLKALKIPRLFNSENFIAKILSDIANKISLNTQTNQTLEEMAQAIFKSWFVDFDPVKAKMNGQQLEGMDAETAALFPNKLVESELGMIPEGWSISSMGEHFNITMGQSPKGETYNEIGEGIAFFQGRRDFGFRYPNMRVFTTDPKRFAKTDDTLISVRAPVGDKNMAAVDCCIGRGIAAIKHKSGSRSFTYAFMSHIEKKLQDSGSSGTVFSSINQKELKSVPFISPPKVLIRAFHNLIDPIDQKIETLSKEINNLTNLRDTLLPKLLSGEIELNKAKELAEAN